MPKVVSYEDYITKNLNKYQDYLSWARFYPDLYLTFFQDPNNDGSGIQLHLDQRVFLRCDIRFRGLYGCFSRGASKSYLEVLADMTTCTLYPNIVIALTAQTKEAAARIMKSKYTEILRHFPLFSQEIVYARFSKNDAEIKFKNGAIYRALANSQNSKGERAHRIRRDESALSDEETYLDAIKPIAEVPRVMTGRARIPNAEELNGQIHSFTTVSWRGSDEFNRCMDMLNNMADHKGDMVLGGCWMLPSWFGRGSTREQILEKARTYTPTQFDMNYMSRWCGSVSGALLQVKKLLKCRTLLDPELESKNETDEYYMAVDVARSENSSNNKSSITIGKVIRNSMGRVQNIELVNIFNVSNMLNFTSQAVIIKQTRKRYNAKVCVVDGNGLGTGLIDALLLETFDPYTGESLGCWDTINTTNQPELLDAEECVFDLKAQTAQSKIITSLIDAVDSGVLRLLESKQYDIAKSMENNHYQDERMPFVQTDLLIEELMNLKLETNGKNLSIKKASGKLDKDRASALMYLVYYILEFENTVQKQDYDIDDIFTFRAPQIRR